MSRFFLWLLCLTMALLALAEFLVHILLQNVGTFVFGIGVLICVLILLHDNRGWRR